MRAEIKAAIKRSHPPRPNITREEQRALRELKNDDTRIILTADKGVCLVVMDKEEYIEKTEELLKEKTYKIIPTDPTNRKKNKLIQILKKIKAGGMSETTYKKIYPTGAGIPKFYGLPKIHKAGVPTTKTHCIQQGVSFLQYSKQTGQDLTTIGRKNHLQCPEHQGLCRTNKEHKTTAR